MMFSSLLISTITGLFGATASMLARLRALALYGRVDVTTHSPGLSASASVLISCRPLSRLANLIERRCSARGTHRIEYSCAC